MMRTFVLLLYLVNVMIIVVKSSVFIVFMQVFFFLFFLIFSFLFTRTSFPDRNCYIFFSLLNVILHSQEYRNKGMVMYTCVCFSFIHAVPQDERIVL